MDEVKSRTARAFRLFPFDRFALPQLNMPRDKQATDKAVKVVDPAKAAEKQASREAAAALALETNPVSFRRQPCHFLEVFADQLLLYSWPG